MKLSWRPLIPGERDPELIWGSVLLAAGFMTVAWLSAKLPTPLCPLHSLTGLPCPTCGMTRGLGCLFRGNLEAAFLFNPLGMMLFLGAAFYILYAAIVVIGRLPRLRWKQIPATTAFRLRIGAVILIATNWAYLILRERSL